ncbi:MULTISPECIES: hypothetical protein [Burkholderia]|uniref:MFS transporter n=1 Tax=Burkholderia mayonis TaxID=1385591 RepID=A0A1B4FE02_9BURK|nr:MULTISPECIES: hypothetical protein [Burkholderia]AOJ01849.1 hypothetical protein WS70_08395 [Burkholderia mayonis]KVE43118.1 hypothetical protein WS69_23920 [Burkholderia sp. BDU5]KVE47291.1 hypothetical protein WS70_26025 [Burkholderia mayonis]
MKRSDNFRVTAAVVASALFMQNLDSTVVATALVVLASAPMFAALPADAGEGLAGRARRSRE